MYNEEQKLKFISDFTKSVARANVCKTIFNAIEPYEEKWGDDMCTRSGEELQPMMNDLIALRSRTTWYRHLVLREYTKWCIANGVDGARDGIFHVKLDSLDRYRRQTIANPLHLKRVLDELYLPEEEKTVDNIMRCFLWLAYGGGDDEDIVNTTKYDVHLDEMYVKCGEYEAVIYREAIPSIKNCMELTQFVYPHPLVPKDKTAYIDRIDGIQLLRGKKHCKLLSIRTNLTKTVKSKRESGETDCEITYFRVWISGVFYRMHERELAGFEVDFRPLAERIVDNYPEPASDKRTRQSQIYEIIREYNSDYIRWKLAHKLA